ncbi:MAG: hypothetical protein ACRD2J_03740 [Thermoanaerobaculia bacterium]
MTTPPPPAFGADRVAVAPDGTVVLTSRFQKGWDGPKDNGLVHAAFPGTCVRWNDAMFEVVAVEALPVGVRYRLRPWDEANVIRTVADYDEASERHRNAERVKESERATFQRLSIPLSILVGNLPGEVQERIGSEMGVLAHRMTITGLVPLFAAGTVSLVFVLAQTAGAPSPVPAPLLLLGLYFFAESCVRFALAFIKEEPAGTLFTAVPYVVWQAIAGAGKPKKPRPQIAPEPSVAERDAYALREPVLALLSPEEQLALRERYGFDPVRWGRRTAAVFLLFSAAGAWTAAGSIENVGGVVAFAVAAYVAVEQVLRLIRLASHQPAGSVFGWLVRPLVAGLLSRTESG